MYSDIIRINGLISHDNKGLSVKSLSLSKSRFMAGQQCHLRLWYQCYRRDLVPGPDPATQYRFDAGHEVGRLATKLFLGGKLVESDHFHHKESVEITAQLIEDKSVPAIFEAGFFYDHVKIRVDVLQRSKAEKWNLIEVKSSTSAKDDYIYDAGIQYHVLTGSGIDIDKIRILHINNEYVYDGESLDLNQLFAFTDITDDVLNAQPEIIELLNQLKDVVNLPDQLDIEPGKQCNGCEFFDHCSKDLPKHWILKLPRLSEKKYLELREMQIKDINDIPEDFPLSANQERIRECVTKQKEYTGPSLEQALEEPAFPIYFLDFETINPGIPRYAGTRPYQMIPFQWSLHVLHKDGTLEHYEYLHNEDTDPRASLAGSLIQNIGERGTIIHYTPFEGTILRKLGGDLPEYKTKIDTLSNRLWDLHKVIAQHYYHPGFNESYSIKSVLPALVPELSYNDLEIQDGNMASVEYLRMIDRDTDLNEKAKIRQGLIKYCEQDTLGMVEVFRVLKAKL